MTSVLLADNFPLPPAVVTESVAIIGRKGSGKTYTGGRLFEQMFKIGAQCVVLDPVGKWTGLRLSATGKRRGLDIPIFGGLRGDMPITPQGGKLMAQVVVERGISCVIDLMNFRPTQRKEFVTDFAEELFELKKRDQSPMHLFLEEARKFIPQQQRGKQDTRMIEAFEDIVRLGRNYGLGVSLLDQRPQSVNKEVLSQTEILIVHQLVEKLGRKEIEDWVRDKTTKGAESLAELDQLRAGEAFVWSPGLLRTFAKVKVGKKSTYDSSATPKVGEKRKVEPQPLSSKDLAKLREAMAEVVEEAEAKDPSKLQAEVRRLKAANAELMAGAERAIQAQLNKRPAPKTKEVVTEKRVEVPVIPKALVDQCLKLEGYVSKALSPIGDQVAKAMNLVGEFSKAVAKQAETQPKPKRLLTEHQPVVHRPAQPVIKNGFTPVVVAGDVELTGPELRILQAVAWLESLGATESPSAVAVAVMAGYSPTGGSFTNPRSHLRVLGLIEYADNRIRRTQAGCKLVPTPEAPPTTEEMHQAVLARLDGPQRRIMQPLLKAWPNSMTDDDLAAAAGYEPTGGSFTNPRSRLRTLGLVTYPHRKSVRANDFLFPSEM